MRYICALREKSTAFMVMLICYLFTFIPAGHWIMKTCFALMKK